MITPEQQAKWEEYKKTSGFTPTVSTGPSTYDAIDKLVAEKQAANKKPDLLEQASGVVSHIPGVKTIGESIGTLAAAGGQALKGKLGYEPGGAMETLSTGPSGEKLAGAYLQAGSIPAALAAAPETLAGSAAVGAALGAAQSGGKAMEEEKSPLAVGVETAKGATAGGILGGASGAIGKGVEAIGKGIYKTAVPLSTKEAGLVQNYQADMPLWDRIKSIVSEGTAGGPTTAGETAFKHGLKGTESMLGVQAKKAQTTLWNDLISPQLSRSEVKVSMPSFFDQAEEIIKAENPELSRQKDLINALNSLREDYAGVGEVDLNKLQKFKEGWAKFIPEKAYQGKPIAGAFNDVKDIVSDMARKNIYEALGPEVKQAYIDYGNLKAVQELGKKAMTGGKLKGGFGTFWSAVKDMALTPVATIGGRTLYRVGQGIELVGPIGARVVGEVLPPMSEELQ